MWPQKLKNLCAQWRRINYSSKNHHYSKMRLFKGRIPGQIDGCLLMNSSCYGYITVADFSLYKNKIVLKIKKSSYPRTTSVACRHGLWTMKVNIWSRSPQFGSNQTSTFQMRPFSHFQPIRQPDLRWPLALVYDLWPHEHMKILILYQ